MIINICYPDNEEDLVTVFRDLIHAGIFKINEIMRDNPDLKISDIIS